MIYKKLESLVRSAHPMLQQYYFSSKICADFIGFARFFVRTTDSDYILCNEHYTGTSHELTSAGLQ